MGDKITTGDIAASEGSQVVVGKEIVAKLERAGQRDAARAIDAYRSALESAPMDGAEKTAHAAILEDIGNELAKPEPDRSRLQQRADDLRSAAATIPALAEAAKAISGLFG